MQKCGNDISVVEVSNLNGREVSYILKTNNVYSLSNLF